MFSQSWADTGATIDSRLQKSVHFLSGVIGERNVSNYDNLQAAVNYIVQSLQESRYKTKLQSFMASGKKVYNIIAELPGQTQPDQIVLVGAHYDTVIGSPGADDNASGVAVLLALANLLSHQKLDYTIRFVAFVNEEPPFFNTNKMGSRVHAKNCKLKNEQIKAMISLDSVGYYSNSKNSQNYPIPDLALSYPSTGNFIGFVANDISGDLLKQAVEIFRLHSSLPIQSLAISPDLPGIGWSDHYSFWQQGYKAFMVTDTAPFRNPHYHLPSDVESTISYENLSALTLGLVGVLEHLGSNNLQSALVQ